MQPVAPVRPAASKCALPPSRKDYPSCQATQSLNDGKPPKPPKLHKTTFISRASTKYLAKYDVGTQRVLRSQTRQIRPIGPSAPNIDVGTIKD